MSRSFAPSALCEAGKRQVVQKKLLGVRHGFDKGCKKGTNEWNRRDEAYGLVVKVLKESLQGREEVS